MKFKSKELQKNKNNNLIKTNREKTKNFVALIYV